MTKVCIPVRVIFIIIWLDSTIVEHGVFLRQKDSYCREQSVSMFLFFIPSVSDSRLRFFATAPRRRGRFFNGTSPRRGIWSRNLIMVGIYGWISWNYGRNRIQYGWLIMTVLLVWIFFGASEPRACVPKRVGLTQIMALKKGNHNDTQVLGDTGFSDKPSKGFCYPKI